MLAATVFFFFLENTSCFPGLLSKNLNYILNVVRLVSIILLKMALCFDSNG